MPYGDLKVNPCMFICLYIELLFHARLDYSYWFIEVDFENPIGFQFHLNMAQCADVKGIVVLVFCVDLPRKRTLK